MVATFDPDTDDSYFDPDTDEGVGVVVTFDMNRSVTFDPGTYEGVGVVQLPLTRAQMKGLQWFSYL